MPAAPQSPAASGFPCGNTRSRTLTPGDSLFFPESIPRGPCVACPASRSDQPCHAPKTSALLARCDERAIVEFQLTRICGHRSISLPLFRRASNVPAQPGSESQILSGNKATLGSGLPAWVRRSASRFETDSQRIIQIPGEKTGPVLAELRARRRVGRQHSGFRPVNRFSRANWIGSQRPRDLHVARVRAP